MSNYYMLGGDGKEYGPVSAEQLRQWGAEGRANAQTQVRSTEGGAYLAMGMVPELNMPASGYSANPALASVIAQTSGSPSIDSGAQIKRLAAILSASSGWMKFIAVLMFISGGFMVISIVEIIIAWIPIWMGIVLWAAATKAKLAAQTGNEADLAVALDKLRFLFKFYGIMTIVFIVLGFALVFGVLAMGGLSALAAARQSMGP